MLLRRSEATAWIRRLRVPMPSRFALDVGHDLTSSGTITLPQLVGDVFPELVMDAVIIR
jgi:hypothetical protein